MNVKKDYLIIVYFPKTVKSNPGIFLIGFCRTVVIPVEQIFSLRNHGKYRFFCRNDPLAAAFLNILQNPFGNIYKF